jgi:hypothetical protein
MRLEEIAGPMLDDVMTALAASSLGRTVKSVEQPPLPPEMMGLPPEMMGMPPMDAGGVPAEMMGMPPQAMMPPPPPGAGGVPQIGSQEQALRDMIAQQAMQGSEPIGPLPAMPASPYEAM